MASWELPCGGKRRTTCCFSRDLLVFAETTPMIIFVQMDYTILCGYVKWKSSIYDIKIIRIVLMMKLFKSFGFLVNDVRANRLLQRSLHNIIDFSHNACRSIPRMTYFPKEVKWSYSNSIRRLNFLLGFNWCCINT